MIVRLTPQQRIRVAQTLRKQLQLPGLSERQRQAKRRHIWNLMKINEIDAIRRNRGYAVGISSAKEQDPPLSSCASDMPDPSEIERLQRNSKETQEPVTKAFQKHEKPTSGAD
jgi:hypothetical protein